jgi:hypothetical protein
MERMDRVKCEIPGGMSGISKNQRKEKEKVNRK